MAEKLNNFEKQVPTPTYLRMFLEAAETEKMTQCLIMGRYKKSDKLELMAFVQL